MILPGALVLLLALSTPGGATQQADKGTTVRSGNVVAQTAYMTVTQDGDWVYYDYHDGLLDGGWMELHEGTATSDGCEYEGSRTIHSPHPAEINVEREIAHNLSACLLITEIGTQYWDDEPELSMLDEGSTHTEIATPKVTGKKNKGDVSIMATRTAWHRTRHRDPIKITVTRATTNVTYTYNGSCVTNSSGHSTNYYWAAATGWSKASSSTSASRTCSGAITTSYSHFRNSLFCVGQPTTHTKYEPNRIRGNPNGGYTASWSASKSGGCSSWLSFQSHAGIK